VDWVVATNIKRRAKPGDPINGYLVVQQIVLDFIQVVYDKFVGSITHGNATVPAGATFVNVNHGQNTASINVGLAPTTDPGAGVRWWVNTYTTVTFRINLSAAAPLGGTSFDWVAKGVVTN
jgi:hypothetical protein